MPRKRSPALYLASIMAPILERPISSLIPTATSIISVIENCAETLSPEAYGRLAVNCAFLAAGHYAKYRYMPTNRELLDTALDELARYDDESGVDWADIAVPNRSRRVRKPLRIAA